MKKILTLISVLVLLSSCITKKNNSTTDKPIKVVKVKEALGHKNPNLVKANRIIQEAITAHGGDLYKTANYSFIFRNKTYQFINQDNNYVYTRKFTDSSGQKIIDVITNGSFTRKINAKRVTLIEADVQKYINSINSVIYFTALPYKLNDAAVVKKYISNENIKGQDYNVIKVTFKEENGGVDHKDQFYYWVNIKDKKIDYIAYNYEVNGGGVRFRSAYNRSIIGGITFQDYINWKAPLGTPLGDLAFMYTKNKLKKLSKIESESITNLAKK